MIRIDSWSEIAAPDCDSKCRGYVRVVDGNEESYHQFSVRFTDMWSGREKSIRFLLPASAPIFDCLDKDFVPAAWLDEKVEARAKEIADKTLAGKLIPVPILPKRNFFQRLAYVFIGD